MSRFCRAWPPCRTTASSCPTILGHTRRLGPIGGLPGGAGRDPFRPLAAPSCALRLRSGEGVPMATAIISGGRAFRTATPVFSIPSRSLFVGGAFAPNRRPEGNGGHWEGGAFHPEPLPLDPAMVAAKAAPTRGLPCGFSPEPTSGWQQPSLRKEKPLIRDLRLLDPAGSLHPAGDLGLRDPILPGGFHLGDPRHGSSRSPARFAAMRMAAGRAGGPVRARAAPLRFYPGPAGGINRAPYSASECSSDTAIIGTRYSSPRPAFDGGFRPPAGLPFGVDLAPFG